MEEAGKSTGETEQNKKHTRRYKEHLYTTQNVKEPDRSSRRRKSKRRRIERQRSEFDADHPGQDDFLEGSHDSSCSEEYSEGSSGSGESEGSSGSGEKGEDSSNGSQEKGVDSSNGSQEKGVDSSGSEKRGVSGEIPGAKGPEELIWKGLSESVASFPNENFDFQSSESESESDGSSRSLENNLSGDNDDDVSRSSDKSNDSGKSDTSGDSDESGSSEDSDVEASENIMKIVKLFDGSDHSRDEAILEVLELFKDPNMTKTLLKKTVSLIYGLLPKPNLFPPNYYFLIKFLDKIAPPLKPVKHYFCQKCQLYQGLTELPTCAICGDNKADTFYMFSISDCVRNLFEDRKLAKVLSHSVKKDSFICDITDGLEYGKIWENLNKKDIDLTLLWNTDGIQLSESSNIDLWPIQFTISEIPRDLREYYLVVCGIHVSSKKPNLNTFLRPFALEMKDIFEKGGVKWTDPDTENERLSMVLAPVCSLDALARADALNMHHHNGEYPCSRCERRGINIRTRRKGNKRVFPPKNRPSRYRTMKRMLKHAYKAKFKKPVKGMKGPSYVHVIPKFDAPKAVIAESLHNTFSGVVRLFLRTMLTDCNGPWYIKSRLGEINSFLLSVKLPTFLTRSTRTITEWKNYKAHEFMTWLFYLSLPAFEGILDDKYLEHWILLVRSIYLLHKDKISESDLREADSLLKSFHDEIKDLYRYTDSDGRVHDIWLYHFNVHQLLHLVDYTRDWGPSWCTSAFVFESYNGFLKNLVHGYSSVGTELTKSLQILESIRILKYKCQERKPEGSSVLDDRDDENDFVDVRGAPVATISDIVNDVEKQLLLSAGLILNTMTLYKRITASNNEVFTSKLYTREKRRNNYTVRFEGAGLQPKYGEIRYFLKNPTGVIFCLISVFIVDYNKMFVNRSKGVVVRHIVPVIGGNKIELVQFDKSVTKVIRVGNYVCIPPNSIRKRL